ncbi:hypothetical protein [Methanobrevibacter intestini]|uniref:hypothetical protein n=1 Tax=Methanobrevibacter intestini TaxID=2911853 RepID=UPI003D0158F5
MKIDELSEKISEEYKKQKQNKQEFLTKIMKPNLPNNPYELERINHELQIENEKLIKKVEASSEIIDELGRIINRLLIKDSRNMRIKIQNTTKLLNDLYEAIDEHYTETLENNDELAVVRAEAELKLIKKIIDEVEGC